MESVYLLVILPKEYLLYVIYYGYLQNLYIEGCQILIIIYFLIPTSTENNVVFQ